LLAQLIFVKAGTPQFLTHFSTGWPLASLAVSPAIAGTLLAQLIFHFAGTPQ